MRAQVAQGGVHVDVDAPKGQDMARVMEEMRAKYEKIAEKNQQELKNWHEAQVICPFWGFFVCLFQKLCLGKHFSTVMIIFDLVSRSQRCRLW